MTRDEIKDLVERQHQLWNTGDVSTIPEIYAPDFVAHMPKGWTESEVKGHSGIRGAIACIRNAFPDWTETVDDMIIDGDKVVTRYVSKGTHHGIFNGLAPTGSRVELDEISIFRVKDGLIAEQWCLTDETLPRQLLHGRHRS